MPKLKTNKAAKKRFKVTATGKVMVSRSNRRHLLTDKESTDKRALRKWKEIDSTDRGRIRVMLPYDL